MSFAKFLSMLEQKALFFPNLATLPDRTEGMTRSEREFQKELKSILTNYYLPPRRKWKSSSLVSTLHAVEEYSKRFICINSWHENDHESYSMWRLYVPDGLGVVIGSTLSKLIDSIEFHEELKSCCIGRVNYTKRGKGVLGDYFFKRPVFKSEQEIRVILDLRSLHGKKSHPLIQELIENDGVFVPTDLSHLIEEIRLSPGSQPWFKKLLQSQLKRCALGQIKVLRSDLDS